MGTPLLDILTAGLAGGFVYIAFAGYVVHSTPMGEIQSPYLGYTGIAFGLFVGAKLTALFLVPTFGIFVAIPLVLGVQSAHQNLMRIALLSGLGLLLFGS